MWTKQNILDDIDSTYDIVGTIETIGTVDKHPDIIQYRVPVVKLIVSSNERPVYKDSYVTFYVYKEGTVDEVAAYFGSDYNIGNDESAKVEGSLLTYNKFYENRIIRDRIQGAILKLLEEIHTEEETVPNHTERLTWGQRVCLSDGAIEDMTNMMVLFVGKHTSVKDAGANATDTDIYNAVEASVIKTGQLKGWIAA
jgi:hypothetical protein